MCLRAIVLLALVGFGVAARADAPRIDLYTMGVGEDVFSAFGHAAICVDGRCYNYGTADFRTPLPLTWDFIRGRALFWVSVLDEKSMVRFYQRADRTVWRQRLALPSEQIEQLAAALAASTDEKVKYYRYHHFNDNCTTRIRDIIDQCTGGALKRDALSRVRTFRQWAREGFAGNVGLLAVTELLLGQPSDQVTDTWAAMFLPSEMRDLVQQRLGAVPEVIYQSKRAAPDGPRWLGHALFIAVGALLAALVWLGAELGRRRAGWARGLMVPSALVLGLVALILDALFILSSFPELRRNEALLAFWPTDLLLPFLPRHVLRSYTGIRLVALALLALAHLVGFTQPLSPLVMIAVPLLTIRLKVV
jgi:hypothetical protein